MEPIAESVLERFELLEDCLLYTSPSPRDFSCKGGMCATCKAQLVDGEVRMDKNYALVADEIEAGYILTCQSHPTAEAVEIDFDV